MFNSRVDQKPVAEFSDISDVHKYFAKQPDRLVAYIDTGVSKRVSVIGVHIAQLANKVGIPLKYRNTEYKDLPEIFISAENFDNIGTILRAGSSMFSRSQRVTKK